MSYRHLNGFSHFFAASGGIAAAVNDVCSISIQFRLPDCRSITADLARRARTNADGAT
jgi:hypothetical protein